MKIISKFHDYYDSVLQYGADEDLRFVRHTTEFDDKQYRAQNLNFKFKNHPYLYGKTNKIYYESVPFSVLFCSKTYNGIAILTQALEKYLDPIEIEFFYDLDSMVDYLDSKDKKISEQSIPKEHKYNKWVGPWVINNRKSLLEWFSQQGSKENETAMIDRKISIFLKLHTSLYKNHISFANQLQIENNTTSIVNPKLSGIKFFKMVDSFTAYQELSMWVGGVLPSPAMPMIEIADKYKIAEHGFDKWSFRKMPENPRKK